MLDNDDACLRRKVPNSGPTVSGYVRKVGLATSAENGPCRNKSRGSIIKNCRLISTISIDINSLGNVYFGKYLGQETASPCALLLRQISMRCGFWRLGDTPLPVPVWKGP
jgi:hypothetical protein